MRGYVVAGIGTEVGKTVVAAILVEKLRADYWKPVQAGNLDATDTLRVRHLTRHGGVLHPEAWRLNTPVSPHAAADIDGVRIKRASLELPHTGTPMIVELAGGLMVPLDSQPGLSTPAAAMGEPLLERLQAHAGVRFEAERA